MAVVQISRIQVRRGQKNAGSGLPQLASGEIGWAVDTQEMYIGNGSVSEGSPAVGNSKILTEHDNIFTFANTYTYKDTALQTGASATTPIKRTLQSKLDEVVFAKDFGVLNDGSNVTVALQRAVDQLFLNSATKANSSSRVILQLEPGEYTIDNIIFVPPYATIVGAGIDKTVINASTNTAFKMVNSLSTPGAPANESTTDTSNQSRNILMQGMTIKQTTAHSAIELQSTKDSTFRDIKFYGAWSIGDALTSGQTAINAISLATTVTVSNNKFENCTFTKWSYPVRSNDDITNNIFSNCVFDTNLYGVVFGQGTVIGAPNQATGPSNNHISHCTFDNIAREAIWVENGTHNQSNNNRFISVGNVNGTEAAATYAIIKYVDLHNDSTHDYFKRFEQLSYNSTFNSNKFMPIIQGSCNSELNFQDQLPVVTQDPALRYFKLPGDADVSYSIDYTYDSTAVEAYRSGVMHITVDSANDNLLVRDEYDYVGDSSYETNLVLTANYIDLDADTVKDTIEITILNSTAADQGTIKFRVRQKR